MARRKTMPVKPQSPESKNAEDRLRWLSAFEQLIAHLAGMILGFETSRVGEGINHALAELGRFVGVGRAYISQFNDDRSVLTCSHEWCAPQIPPVIHPMCEGRRTPGQWCAPEIPRAIHLNQHVPADMFPWFVGQLKRGEIVLVRDLRGFPAEAGAEREAFTAMRIRSLAAVPLVSRGRVIGVAGFDAVRQEQEWPEGVVRLLKTVGEMLAIAIERERADVQIDLYQGQLRGLAFDLSLAEERERHRIAEDLHDDLIQTLILAKLKLAHLRLALGAKPQSGEVTEVQGLLTQSIQSVRSLIAQLSPPALHDERGFVEAVRGLVEEIHGRYGIQVQLVDDGRPKRLDEQPRVTLFRCLRELLINVAKHAKARATTVRLVGGDGLLEVSVEDDGVGFDPSQLAARPGAKGFGLFSIRERLYSFGGRMDVRSAPGQGTTVTMTVPRDSGLNEERGMI